MSWRRACREAALVAIIGSLSACASSPVGGAADAVPAMDANPACPRLADWGARQVYGDWALELPDLQQHGHMRLSQHPEFSASLRGHLRYGGHTAIASGDLTQGAFVLDESRDGKSLYAFWTGHLVPRTCGNEIRGVWQQVPRGNAPALESRFILRRLSPP